jgi:hypothetical protein
MTRARHKIGRLAAGLALAAGGAGCAATSPPSPPSSPGKLTEIRIPGEIMASAADQVRRCYRTPPGGARSIGTRLRVRLNVDGSLAGLPILLSQSGVTPTNRMFAARVAEAASLAVMRCAPLRLPAQHYAKGWQEFELIFSPRARV